MITDMKVSTSTSTLCLARPKHPVRRSSSISHTLDYDWNSFSSVNWPFEWSALGCYKGDTLTLYRTSNPYNGYLIDSNNLNNATLNCIFT